jgi:hypothetical protein
VTEDVAGYLRLVTGAEASTAGRLRSVLADLMPMDDRAWIAPDIYAPPTFSDASSRRIIGTRKAPSPAEGSTA